MAKKHYNYVVRYTSTINGYQRSNIHSYSHEKPACLLIEDLIDEFNNACCKGENANVKITGKINDISYHSVNGKQITIKCNDDKIVIRYKKEYTPLYEIVSYKIGESTPYRDLKVIETDLFIFQAEKAFLDIFNSKFNEKIEYCNNWGEAVRRTKDYIFSANENGTFDYDGRRYEVREMESEED